MEGHGPWCFLICYIPQWCFSWVQLDLYLNVVVVSLSLWILYRLVGRIFFSYGSSTNVFIDSHCLGTILENLLSLILSDSFLVIHKHRHTNTCTQRYTNIHTYEYSHSLRHTHIPIHICTFTYTWTHYYICLHINIQTHILSYIYIYSFTLAQKYIYMHSHMQICIKIRVPHYRKK